MKAENTGRRACLVALSAILLAAVSFAGAPLGAQNMMEVSSTSTSPGGNATVQVLLTHDTNVQGFQTAMTWNNTILTSTLINTTGMAIVGLLAPGSIEFFTTNVNPALSPGVGWGAAAAIFDFGPPFTGQILPPGVDQSIVFYRFSTSSSLSLIGTSTTVQLENGLGSPPIFNVITVAGSSVLPVRVPGTITFVDQPLLKRGDANGDGLVNLADAIFMIQYIFNDGNVPTCMESSDANGDNFSNLADVIFLIQFQFLDGNQPPQPYPACGVDPAGGTTNCQAYNAC